MHCPKCKNEFSKVIETRASRASIRRRRQCEKCGFRYSTIEEIKAYDISVIKRDGTKSIFNEQKLEKGIRKSFNKRKVDDEKLITIMQHIIEGILALDKTLVTSVEIGMIVLNILKQNDAAAFICYSAMFGNFDTIQDFKNLIV
jgi:transcriptional repressor NrdR